MQGDYHHKDDLVHASWWNSTASKKMMKNLENLILALKSKYAINQLIMHREVLRAGEPTVCPGDHLAAEVIKLRKN